MKTKIKIAFILLLIFSLVECAVVKNTIIGVEDIAADNGDDNDDDDDDGDDSGINIRVDGGWVDLTIGSADLIGGAGTDLIDKYTSTSDATFVDIRKVKKTDSWRIDVRRSDYNWHENLYLYVRRTGSGNGNGRAIGGLSYIEINYIDRELFHGRGRLNNIPLQYQLSGVSLQIPPDTYNTTIIFTIMEL